MRTFIDDLDVYANGLGLKKWAAPLMIIIFPTTWGIIVYRFGNWTFKNINVILIRHLLILIYYIFKRITEILTSIEIDYQAEIGKGLYIGHYSIVIGKHSTIGDYPRIMGNVTIGGAGREGNYGNPKIGNNVYFGTGSRIIGKIEIGNNVMIGANAVVSKSFPNNAVLGGVPAKIINYKGSNEYIPFKGR